jgi:hypothetical protein
MKVYLVLEGVRHEGATVLKVFQDEVKANLFCKELEEKNTYRSIYFEVEEQELVV